MVADAEVKQTGPQMNVPPSLPDEVIPRPALVDWNALRRALTRYSMIEGAAVSSVLVWVVLVSALSPVVRPTGTQVLADQRWALVAVAILCFVTICGFHQITFRLLTRPATPYKSREALAGRYRSLTLWGGLIWFSGVSAVVAVIAQAAPPFQPPAWLLALWLMVGIPPLLAGMISIHELRFRLGLAPVRQREEAPEDAFLTPDWPTLWRKVRRKVWRNAALAAGLFVLARAVGIGLDAAAEDIPPDREAVIVIIIFAAVLLFAYLLWSEWTIHRTRHDLEYEPEIGLTRERMSYTAYKHLRETALLLVWIAGLIVIMVAGLVPQEVAPALRDSRANLSLFLIPLIFNPLPGHVRLALGLPPLRLAKLKPEKRKRANKHSGIL